MKGRELLETYPKIAKIIKDWFTTKMIENMPFDMPEDFKNHIMERGADDEFLVNVIDKNPAALFEIFDSLGVYIGTSVSRLPLTDKIVFNYYICPNGKCTDGPSEDYIKRRDMEYYAMLAAVEYINNLSEN